MHFARSLPLAKALHPDTLLASSHERRGARRRATVIPLRLFVPGWYGVASVKWLRRIEVRGPAVSRLLPDRQVHGAAPDGARPGNATIVGPMAVKSEIIRPTQRDRAGPRHESPLRCRLGRRGVGAAASRSARTAARIWGDADLIGPAGPLLLDAVGVSVGGGDAGQLHAAGAGRLRQRRRAADAARPAQYGGYLIHHSRPLTVRVEAAQAAPMPTCCCTT